jgi:hypothetical protein
MRLILLVVVLASGCAKDGRQCPAIASDPSWQSLEAAMSLTDSRKHRLDDYVSTLEASSCQVGRMAPQTRARAAVLLDAEIARSIPLFVPDGYRGKAHDYLRGALELR